MGPFRNSNQKAVDRVFQSAALLRAHPGNAALLLLDGNAGFADIDLNTGGLLPLLVELIANHHGDDGERADDEIENIAIHDRAPRLGFENASAKTN